MRPLLPGKDELLMACRGFPLPAEDPVLSAAAELAVLHQRRERTAWEAVAVIDAYRARLMGTIDTWVQAVNQFSLRTNGRRSDIVHRSGIVLPQQTLGNGPGCR
ncbi:hypothetical protein [Nocardia sp. R7R-8]|uniref:hypothetical protein n=1 Tax=Nocardia sp. R7R-8 TaxID=3459304 RepID=UPI00403DF1FC